MRASRAVQVTSVEEWAAFSAGKIPGETVVLTVLRGTTVEAKSVTLGARNFKLADVLETVRLAAGEPEPRTSTISEFLESS